MMAQVGDKLEYIDLLLIHSPLPGKTKRLESWKVLQDAVEKGWIKTLGFLIMVNIILKNC